MTRLRRLLLIVAVVAVLLVSTASVATAASGCRFITDYSGNIVRVQCDTIA
jgi:conjugal transfer/entry exclusion protein